MLQVDSVRPQQASRTRRRASTGLMPKEAIERYSVGEHYVWISNDVMVLFSASVLTIARVEQAVIECRLALK